MKFMESFFAKNFKFLILKKNLQQKDVAEDLNLTRTQINNWCSGRTQPNLEQLSRLAEYFKITTDGLLGLEPPAKTVPELTTDEQKVLDTFRNASEADKRVMLRMLKSFEIPVETEHSNKIG